MMYANYHTHTYKCRHAMGTERDFIEKAIGSGIRVLGFADHSPCIFSGDYYRSYGNGHFYSNFRMTPEETEHYFRTICDLRDEYRGQIEIHVGVELEYYPRFFEETVRFLAGFPCEYLLLGQHTLDSEIGPHSVASARPTDDPEVARRYTAEVEEGLATGVFLYLAHPDLMLYTGPDEGLRRSLDERICDAALHADVPLEINMLGLAEHRHYPRDNFWRIAAEKGNRVIIGADAHRKAALGDEETYRRALEMAASFGLSPEKELPMKPLRV